MTDLNGTGDTDLRAGAASHALPVPPSVAMAGYVERRQPSTGVHDEPQVTALALRREETVAVLVGIDLVAVDTELRTAVAAAAGIPRESLLIGASHTHSGPDGVISRPAAHPVDGEYRRQLCEVIVAAVTEALELSCPARLRLGRAETRGVAANRNIKDKAVDHRITTLVAEATETSERIATVVHFACHPTVLGPDNLLISADFPGALRHELSTLDRAGDAPVLFLNGAAGDVSTRFTRQGQDFEEVGRIGRLLGESAADSMRKSRPIVATPLRVIDADADIPGKPAVPVPEAEATLRAFEEELRLAGESGADVRTIRRLTTKVQGATKELARARGAGLTAPPVAISIVQVGPLAFVGLSAEISSALGAAVEAGSPLADTVVVGLSNGYCGYITDAEDYAAGTYESLSSAYQASAAGALVEEAVALLRPLG